MKLAYSHKIVVVVVAAIKALCQLCWTNILGSPHLYIKTPFNLFYEFNEFINPSLIHVIELNRACGNM